MSSLRLLRILGVVALSTSSTSMVCAQDTRELILDLATAGKQSKVSIVPDKYQVRVISKLPQAKYNIRVSVVRPIEPLPNITSKGALDDVCKPLVDATDDLAKTTDEAQVPPKLASVESQIKSADDGCKAKVQQARVVTGATEYLDNNTYDLKDGYYITAVVERLDADGKVSRAWERTFTTVQKHWDVSYGYAFAAMGGLNKLFKDQQTFYAKAVPNDTNKYAITREARPDRWQSAPTAFFNWVNVESETWHGVPRWILPGLTTGLSIDLENPSVLGGMLWTYHTNVHASVGVLMHRERVLGNYTEGQVVSENLTADQLHTMQLRARPYIAVSWRFADNPFKSATKGEAQPEKKADSASSEDKKGSGAQDKKPIEGNP